jgi:hypothetical protein
MELKEQGGQAETGKTDHGRVGWLGNKGVRGVHGATGGTQGRAWSLANLHPSDASLKSRPDEAYQDAMNQSSDEETP